MAKFRGLKEMISFHPVRTHIWRYFNPTLRGSNSRSQLVLAPLGFLRDSVKNIFVDFFFKNPKYGVEDYPCRGEGAIILVYFQFASQAGLPLL